MTTLEQKARSIGERAKVGPLTVISLLTLLIPVIQEIVQLFFSLRGEAKGRDITRYLEGRDVGFFRRPFARLNRYRKVREAVAFRLIGIVDDCEDEAVEEIGKTTELEWDSLIEDSKRRRGLTSNGPGL